MRLPAKELVKSTLRMKFDRVFLAELRGDETWDYLTLLEYWHAGGHHHRSLQRQPCSTRRGSPR